MGHVNLEGTGVTRNFEWREPKIEKFCDAILATFFGDVITMTSELIFSNFNFVIISLKNHNLAKSHYFRHQNRRLSGAGGSPTPALGDFFIFVTEIMQFRHISAEKSEICSMLVLSNARQYFDWRAGLLSLRPCFKVSYSCYFIYRDFFA